MTARRIGRIGLLRGVCLAFVVAVSTACGSSEPPTAEPTATTAAPSASAEASTSSSPEASTAPSPSPTLDLGLPHIDAALEDLLPNTVGHIPLQKFSVPLSTYIASFSGGDNDLLGPWVIHFGMTADEIDMAVATDLTKQIDFFVQGIQVPEAKPADLTAEFARLAREAGWPVTGRTVASRIVLEITDPAAQAAGELATAYVLATGDVMFVIVTDDPSLLVECLIKLPE
jgi:hypothetical protein